MTKKLRLPLVTVKENRQPLRILRDQWANRQKDCGRLVRKNDSQMARSWQLDFLLLEQTMETFSRLKKERFRRRHWVQVYKTPHLNLEEKELPYQKRTLREIHIRQTLVEKLILKLEIHFRQTLVAK